MATDFGLSARKKGVLRIHTAGCQLHCPGPTTLTTSSSSRTFGLRVVNLGEKTRLEDVDRRIPIRGGASEDEEVGVRSLITGFGMFISNAKDVSVVELVSRLLAYESRGTPEHLDGACAVGCGDTSWVEASGCVEVDGDGSVGETVAQRLQRRSTDAPRPRSLEASLQAYRTPAQVEPAVTPLWLHQAVPAYPLTRFVAGCEAERRLRYVACLECAS